MVEPGSILPFQSEETDILRDGPKQLKGDVLPIHPVYKIQKHLQQEREKEMRQMLRHAYGVALPARMDIEKSILEGCERLPCLPSSKLGLDVMSGRLNELDFDDVLDLPEMRVEVLPDMASMVEPRLGMNTKYSKRGAF